MVVVVRRGEVQRMLGDVEEAFMTAAYPADVRPFRARKR